jgi:hypothetical protein
MSTKNRPVVCDQCHTSGSSGFSLKNDPCKNECGGCKKKCEGTYCITTDESTRHKIDRKTCICKDYDRLHWDLYYVEVNRLRCAIYQKQDELVDMLCKGATPSSIARHKADLAALLKEKLQLLSGETNVGTKPVPLQPEAMVCI